MTTKMDEFSARAKGASTTKAKVCGQVCVTVEEAV